MSALDVQVGGSHYKDCAIQPVEYIYANGAGYFEGNVIKYVTRWKTKNGIPDLQKARHYLDLLIELETKRAKAAAAPRPGYAHPLPTPAPEPLPNIAEFFAEPASSPGIRPVSLDKAHHGR